MDTSESLPTPQLRGSLLSHADLQDSRMSLPLTTRLKGALGVSFISGALLGITHGSRTSGLRFRAENSHRFPTTTKGWYLYHKSKNYHVALGGLKEGSKLGTKLACLTGGFFYLENLIDDARNEKDFMSTTAAGVVVAGGFSAWNRLPFRTAARTARLGFYGGMVLGLLQDVLWIARGHRPAYIEYATGMFNSIW